MHSQAGKVNSTFFKNTIVRVDVERNGFVVLQYIHRSRDICAKERHTGGYFHRAAAADREMLV